MVREVVPPQYGLRQIKPKRPKGLFKVLTGGIVSMWRRQKKTRGRGGWFVNMSSISFSSSVSVYFGWGDSHVFPRDKAGFESRFVWTQRKGSDRGLLLLQMGDTQQNKYLFIPFSPQVLYFLLVGFFYSLFRIVCFSVSSFKYPPFHCIQPWPPGPDPQRPPWVRRRFWGGGVVIWGRGVGKFYRCKKTRYFLNFLRFLTLPSGHKAHLRRALMGSWYFPIQMLNHYLFDSVD